jgi:murein DD-endopeptidase MepM/ murein hydrolase activator NlpD
MGFGKKIALTAVFLGIGAGLSMPVVLGAAVIAISGGSSCTAVGSVALADANQLTGMSAKDYLAQFSKEDQAAKLAIATSIYQVGVSRSPAESSRAIAAAIAAGIQESNLTNNPGGDRDSAGVFQMRPSQGWGTRDEVLDVTYAANKWFDTLHRNVPGSIDSMPLIDIAIDVENPNLNAYHSRWNWDKTAAELLTTVAVPGASQSCQTTGWTLPLEAKTYTINDEFGMRLDPIFLKVMLHDGVDLGAAKDTPIHAAHSGTVLFAGPNGSYGNYVGLDNGDGIVTGYGHMTSVAPGLKAGDQVSTGQVIGYVGSTGGSTGNHLHFLLHINGKPSDPVAFMNSNGVSFKDNKR